jgi:AcrR family transcriptional regulator
MTVTRRYAAGETSREAILDAAERLMAVHGFAGASISRIERASGLPASSIYWHFGSKDGVLLAMMQRGADRFFGTLPRAAEFEGGPVERIEGAFAMAAQLLDEHPLFLRLLITLGLQHQEGDPKVIELIRAVRTRARERLEDALRAALGGLPEEDRDPAAAELARIGIALTDGAFLARHIDEDFDLETMFRQVANALAALIAARTG